MASNAKFYGTGAYKGLTKRNFYEIVLSILNNEEVESIQADFVKDACDYELAKIAQGRKGDATPKNRMETDYAKAIMQDILPLVTKEPQSVNDILQVAEEKGITSPKGNPYSFIWVAQVLKFKAEEGELKECQVVVTKTDKNGLKRQVPVKGYCKA